MNQVSHVTFTRSMSEGVLVITIAGRLTAAGGDQLFKREIARALDEGERRIVLDFHDLQTLDSSGLGELMSASMLVSGADGRMAWAACPRTMLDLLRITKVQPVGVTFADSADRGVEALRAS